MKNNIILLLISFFYLAISCGKKSIDKNKNFEEYHAKDIAFCKKVNRQVYIKRDTLSFEYFLFKCDQRSDEIPYYLIEKYTNLPRLIPDGEKYSYDGGLFGLSSVTGFFEIRIQAYCDDKPPYAIMASCNQQKVIDEKCFIRASCWECPRDKEYYSQSIGGFGDTIALEYGFIPDTKRPLHLDANGVTKIEMWLMDSQGKFKHVKTKRIK